MDALLLVVDIVFRGLGGSLLIAAVMFVLMLTGANISDRAHRLAAIVASVPLLALVALLGVALVRRGYVA